MEEEDKVKSHYRYSSVNSPTPNIRLITHPTSESSTSGDEGNTETCDAKGPFDERGYEEIDSLKETKNSIGVNDELKTGGNTFRISDSEDSSSGENSDWNKMDSRTETENIEEYDKNPDQLPVHNNSLSVDAISMNDIHHRQDGYQHQDQFQVTRDCLKSRNQLKDDFHCKQTPVGNNPYPIVSSRPFYDAIVVYAKDDFNEVTDFTHYLQAAMNCETQYVPDIELYDHGIFCSSTVRGVEDVMNKASVVFVYLTPNLNSEALNVFIDEAVSLSRLNMNPAYVMTGRGTTDRKWALKPVHTFPASSRNYKVPAGLVSCRGIDWYDKDSQHTRSTIVSIMKEARRIREEADRREVGNTFQSQFLLPRSVQLPYVPTKEILTPKGASSFQQPVETNNRGISITDTGSGEFRVRFRPSVKPPHPPVGYHSPGPPVNQPLYYQTSHQLYARASEPPRINMYPGVQNQPAAYYTRHPINPGHRLPPPATSQVYSDHISGDQYSIPLYQPQAPGTYSRYGDRDIDNRQSFESAQTSQSGSGNMGSQDRHDVRHTSRRQRQGKFFRNSLDRSVSETSSGDESDDFEDPLPADMKKKRNINIIGCKFVQLGAGNKVFDGQATSKKKKKAKSSRRVKHDESGGDEPIGPVSKATSKHKTERNEPEQDLNQSTHLVSEPRQGHSSARSSQIFNSSVTEDNMDITNSDMPYRSNKQPVSEKSKFSKDKDLTFPDLKESESKVNNTVITTVDERTSAARGAINVKLKSSGELREYQLTANGKKKDVFVNDLDKADDDETVLGESVTGQNIHCDSSGDDNNASSLEDHTDSEKESHTNKLLQEHTDNNERSVGEKCANHQKPVQVVKPLPKPPKSIDFMSMIDTLKIISTKSGAYTNPNAKSTSVLSEEEVE